MSSSLRRGVAAAFFAFSIAGVTTACGAGNDAQTDRNRPDNASATVDDIKVQNVNVVLPDGADGPGGISARLFNGGAEDQVLDAVVLTGADRPVELIPAEGESSIVVPARGSVALGGEGNPAAYIDDPAAVDVALGNAQQLVFVLSDTGEISLSARVVGGTEDWAHYDDWGPTPTAPADPTAPEEGQEGQEGEPGEPGQDGEEPGDGTDGGEGADGGTGETPGDTPGDTPDGGATGETPEAPAGGGTDGTDGGGLVEG
ncbi:hypothetical protein [Streptomyces sp. MP131-18]|uniref:hypothetical protein n=1 Tax=Streptomyces sp. MP131-18 TaxID=1857892 RepID=UPI00097CA17D|nr:hypothetical protein [Streptomyces sp. MP131-18]ONK13495.1 hypothetical protein STBA_42620 [Streptomyces sp. MP131-18]